MISLPKDIRIGLPTKTKRRRKQATARAAAAPGAAWRDHTSISQGCHPQQVPRYRQFVKDFGLNDVAVRNDGSIQFTSRQGMKQWCRATGQCNIDETS